MSLKDQLAQLLRATCTGIWVTTLEPQEVEREVVCLAQGWADGCNLFRWDAHRGLQKLHEAQAVNNLPQNSQAPQRALEAMATLGQSGADTNILLLYNFQKFLHLPDVLQGLANQLQAGKDTRTFAIVLTPQASLPVELRTYFTHLTHELPSREEMATILQELCPEFAGREIPSTILDAVAGLTRYEAENAFSLSIVQSGRLEPRPLWEYKSATLAKGGVLSLYRGTEGFDTLGGLSGGQRPIRGRCWSCSQERQASAGGRARRPNHPSRPNFPSPTASYGCSPARAAGRYGTGSPMSAAGEP
jgi:hypothetical protein